MVTARLEPSVVFRRGTRRGAAKQAASSYARERPLTRWDFGKATVGTSGEPLGFLGLDGLD